MRRQPRRSYEDRFGALQGAIRDQVVRGMAIPLNMDHAKVLSTMQALEDGSAEYMGAVGDVLVTTSSGDKPSEQDELVDPHKAAIRTDAWYKDKGTGYTAANNKVIVKNSDDTWVAVDSMAY